MADNPSCFVIGPIGDRLADVGTPARQVYEHAIQVWENIILPACESNSLKPLRADHISRTGEIVDQVCRHLRVADLVIADLTGANPNVMYELGLRHTVNRPTIQIGERGRLPFDISAIRTIQFTRSESGFIDARERLVEAIKTGLAEGGDPVTATRVWNDLPPDLHHATTVEDSEEKLDDEELGFLEKLAATEEGVETMKSILESMTGVMNNIGAIAKSATDEVKRSDSGGGGARARLVIVERVAKKLDEQGATLEAQSKEFEDCVNRIDPGVDYLLERLESDLELRAQTTAFSASLCHLAEATESSEPIFASFREVMKSTGAASRSMRRATTRVIQAVDRQQRAAERFKQWRDRIQEMRDDS